eukprot:362798-Chlamydomonas_euryale.AAC.4
MAAASISSFSKKTFTYEEVLSTARLSSTWRGPEGRTTPPGAVQRQAHHGCREHGRSRAGSRRPTVSSTRRHITAVEDL